jgi:anti-sigma factor RsiW
MKCEDVREYLPDFLAGEAAAGVRATVEAHLAECPACREDAAMWARMDAWPDEQPSPALRERFDAVLAAYRSGFDHAGRGARGRFSFAGWLESWWPAQPALQFTLVVAALGAGLLGGFGIASRGGGSAEMARLKEEVHSTRQLVAVSLLQQQSASERLRGVNWSYRVDQPDAQVVTALVHALQYDTSVDVRLAAADALQRYTAQPAVQQGIIAALRPPQSPLVQIALIDLIVEARMSQAAGAVRELGRDAAVDQTVRRRAEWGLQHF